MIKKLNKNRMTLIYTISIYICVIKWYNLEILNNIKNEKSLVSELISEMLRRNMMNIGKMTENDDINIRIMENCIKMVHNK